jgi:hypothetical protein
MWRGAKGIAAEMMVVAVVLGRAAIVAALCQEPQLVVGRWTCSRRNHTALSRPPTCLWSLTGCQPSGLSGEDAGQVPDVRCGTGGVLRRASGDV